MILKQGNKNKDIEKKWRDMDFYRYPVKTAIITENDTIVEVIREYAGGFLQDGDVVGIAESVLAVIQKRAYKFSEIKFGFFAEILSGFVTRTPAGIGLGTPQTMQLAINEVGLLRVLFAAFVAGITKPIGISGMFYRIAGDRARGIDGPTDNTIPPYNEYASLLPKNPNKIIKNLETEFADKNIHFCIVDANDIGVNLIGSYDADFADFMKTMFADNPLGQGAESTPLLICRKK
ncbi:MAG: coenzyme F420-0:L-glutamate ligase [Minisyncoccia bacterium]